MFYKVIRQLTTVFNPKLSCLRVFKVIGQMYISWILVGLMTLIESSVGSGVGGSGSGSSVSNNELWNSRNVDAYFSRLGSRMDQLVLRFDHLDSRLNRFTSLMQGRLDGVENSLSTTKLKMDLWGEELSRIDEQLTRKWKNVEAKLELLVPTIESKLENKVTLIQRDNRRHNEHLSSILMGMGQRFDTKAETIMAAVSMMQQNRSLNNGGCEPIRLQETGTQKAMPTTSTPAPAAQVQINDDTLVDMLQKYTNRSEELLQSNSAISLIATKVTNMFEDLIQRSDSIQTEVKDSISISNITRHEVRESLRSLTHNRLRHSFTQNGGSASSSETMSAVIVEALASVESMSTALGRRMAELSRSIDGRFEMVSMTLNSFLDSCHRIQEGAPLIEEHIASILEKILDGIDNTTRAGQEEMYGLSRKLDDLKMRNGNCEILKGGSGGEDEGSEVKRTLSNSKLLIPPAAVDVNLPSSGLDEDPNKFRAAEILENSQDLTEDEKKLLWDSLFPNQVPD